MFKLVIALVLLVMAGPDLVLRSRRPQWLSRLAFRPMAVTRRFSLEVGARAPTDRATYREDALPRDAGEIPDFDGEIDIGNATLIPDGAGAFALVGGSGGSIAESFIVRIDARVERGQVILRARQALPVLFLPFVVLGVLAWLYSANPNNEVGVVAVGLVGAASSLGWLWMQTRVRDLRTARAMERIEEAMCAAEPDEESAEDGTRVD